MDLKVRSSAKIMVFSETRISKENAETAARSLGFHGDFATDPVGYNGGLWMFWDTAAVNVTILGSTSQEIHAMVTDPTIPLCDHSIYLP